MTIDPYTFTVDKQNNFIHREQSVSGQQWVKECIALAQEINSYSERNWLLYQDDFYQFSVNFFALLLADKNIVLSQSEQTERLQQAAKFADISIGDRVIAESAESAGGDIGIGESDVDESNLANNYHKNYLKNNQSQPLAHFSRDKDFLAQDSTAVALNINANTTITLFTSGSSGDAKAIKKCWYQLANEVVCLEQLFPDENSCVLSTVTHKHIYGLLFKLIWPVFTDKQIICETIEYPEQIELYSQNLANLLLISSPSYLARTAQQFSAQAMTNIQRVFCSGGALSANIADEIFGKYQQAITEVYGSTETGGIAWRQQSGNVQWQLFPQHQVSLAKDDTLVLKSNFLAKDDCYKTDDRVELNGRFFNLLGRVDRIIKLHEKRLSLDEMEKQLTSLENVNACHCFVLDNLGSKTALVTVIELKNNYLLPSDLIQRKQLISTYKKVLLSVFEPSLLPRKWRFVAQLPFNSQGKLVKTELVDLFKSSNMVNEEVLMSSGINE